MEKENQKGLKIWKIIISLICIVLTVMLAYVLIWTKRVFGDIPFSQTLFHLMVPVEGTDSDIINNYFVNAFIYIVIALLWVAILFMPDIMDWLYRGKKPKKKINNNDKDNKTDINLNEKTKNEKSFISKLLYFVSGVIEKIRLLLTRHLLPISIVPLIVVVCIDIDGFGIDEWLMDRFDSTTIFEDYYVDSATANITAPSGKKKNLIYILSESLEGSFCSEAEGGFMEYDVMPNLTNLANENTHFSQYDNMIGATEVEGTGWTIAAMVAQMSGVPLNLPIGQNNYGEYAEFLPGITSLGEILEKNGYNNQMVVGSKTEFAGTDTFLKQHGNYNIFDFYTAKEEGYIEKHNGFWGVEDEILFDVAKDKIELLTASDKPFNIMINTIDLHTPSGYKCDRCDSTYENLLGGTVGQYMDIIACQDRQISEFVEWCKTQDFYEDTVIVISGDHLSMAPVVRDSMAVDGYERTTYNAIINSSLQPINTTNRRFTTMDMFPTVLASLGFSIEGERLGLGTNLYSGKKTVMEELGKEKFKDEISKNSVLYNEDIVGIK